MSSARRKAHKLCALWFAADLCIFCELACAECMCKRILYAACLVVAVSMAVRRRLMISAGVLDVAGLDEHAARMQLSSFRPDFLPPLWYTELAVMGGQILFVLAGSFCLTCSAFV
ncbi:unnamed protein product [Prorocentrum cordatum]|uniref:Uncharacterized protein n=1 Tax=Prorocentrum cordatum TaxID=2364126 RepID=A0ABN9YA92_9DINO|nr:unnamed protein product [Polarella glacialis]